MREYVTRGRKREGEKERKKERKKGRKEKKEEGKGEDGRLWLGGGRRRRPELAGEGGPSSKPKGRRWYNSS